MSANDEGRREGSLEAPIRHPIKWQDAEFYEEAPLYAELERVYDICHGCRRCVSLCNAFPTLFDLVDGSETLEVDGVAKADYGKVVEHCYLCDLCYMTKCPYVPPHEWNVDFPHLMLRAKAFNFSRGKTKTRDKLLSDTDKIGNIAGIPVVSKTLNALTKSQAARKTLGKALGVHPEAIIPTYHSATSRKRFGKREAPSITATAAGQTRGRVAIFTTCYGNRNEPDLVEDLIAVFEHNQIPVCLTAREKCCGMPKFELGDLESVEKAKAFNIPELLQVVNDGWDIIAPIPSCVLMFKQEIPLMFPDEPDVRCVAGAIFDPFEYLMRRHKEGKFNTDFKQPLGKIAYHAPCHLRVQNIGLRTRDILALVPDTQIELIERCSGHDGTYAVKQEFYATAVKLCRPVVGRVQKAAAAHYTSDCPMAANLIGQGLGGDPPPSNPLQLLRLAYGI